jgi:hypothetical protein
VRFFKSKVKSLKIVDKSLLIKIHSDFLKQSNK